MSLNNALVYLQQQAKAAAVAQKAEIVSHPIDTLRTASKVMERSADVPQDGHQRIRQNYTTDIEVMLGALGHFSGTVLSLQTNLDETSKKLKGMGSLGSLFLLVPGIFFIVAVSFVHRKLAGYLGIVACKDSLCSYSPSSFVST